MFRISAWVPIVSLLGGCALGTFVTTSASAQSWTGDFETNDFSQYSFQLNPTVDGRDYQTVVTDVVAEGTFAARIELHDDARWPNNLRRVELQHRPEEGRTSEGTETFIAWSFYFPEEIASEPRTQIAYWESDNSYQQMMAFAVWGQNINFSTRQPDNNVQWEATGVVTPGEWHRIAMRVAWTTGSGTVDVWFDGEQVVENGPAKTLADGNNHFFQHGMLRGDADFADIPVIYMDHALEGDSLLEVQYDVLPGDPPTPDAGVPDAGGEDAGTGDSGTPTDSGTGSDAGMRSDSGGRDAGAARNDAGSTGGDVGGSCGCAVTAPKSVAGLWALIGICVLFRRRH